MLSRTQWRLISSVGDHPMIPDSPRRSAGAEERKVFPNDRIEPDEQRPRHDRMTDRYLVQKRQGAEEREVVEIEIVACIDAEPKGMRELRHLGVLCERSTAFVRARLERARVRF